jgi:hypothetical protein
MFPKIEHEKRYTNGGVNVFPENFHLPNDSHEENFNVDRSGKPSGIRINRKSSK